MIDLSTLIISDFSKNCKGGANPGRLLEKPRSRQELTAKEKTIHEQGLASVLRQIHDDLDAAVFAAYGWLATLTDDELAARFTRAQREILDEFLQALVALGQARRTRGGKYTC